MKQLLFGMALISLLSKPVIAEDTTKIPQGKARHRELQLTIRLGKKEYRLGEKIALSFELKNLSKKSLYIGDGFLSPKYQEVGPGRHFQLYTTAGEKTELRFWSGRMTEGTAAGVRKVYLLKPGEAYRGAIPLHNGIQKEKSESAGSFATVEGDQRHRLGRDGERYTLRLRYQVKEDSFGLWEPPKAFEKSLLWLGEMTTSPVTLMIKKP